jgi:hypothetical protein
MKKYSTIFLQTVVLLLGVGVFVAMLWEPQLEGRNVGATFFKIYFQDPFLVYVYLSSISFFIGLHRMFRFLGYVRQNKVFSHKAMDTLRTVRYCTLATAGSILLAEFYLFIFNRAQDDGAGAAMLGLIAILLSLTIAAAIAIFESVLQKIVDKK